MMRPCIHSNQIPAQIHNNKLVLD